MRTLICGRWRNTSKIGIDRRFRLLELVG
ncbi:MAG: hypothetical protein QOF32_1734, partial [Gammaproteobacteria bacterium]|nr:hypothetical protein [Gammaproteobacteria bacterium]